MSISPETIDKVVSRVWHVGLLVGSALAAQNPTKYGWIIPMLQAMGQVSNPVK